MMKAWDGISKLMEPTFEKLDASDTSMLQDVLFKGDPWVIFCGQKLDGGRVNVTYNSRVSIAPSKVFDKLAAHAKGRFRVGLLDCNFKLPSGKNIYERFKLKPKSASHIAFWVGNGHLPKLIDPHHYRSVIDYDVARFAKNVAAWTVLKAENLVSTKQLTKKCVNSKKGCLLLINRGPKLSINAQAELKKVMKDNRKFKYYILDISKRQISLHMPPAMMGYPQLVFIRRATEGEGIDRHYVHSYSVFDDEFEAKEVNKFIAEGSEVDSASKFWSALEPLPRLSKISPPPGASEGAKRKPRPKGPSRRKDSKRKERESSSKKKQEQRKKAEEPKADPISDEEQYKRRRRQMDEDMINNAPQASSEDDEDAWEDEQVEEEEIIDLDDEEELEDVVEIYPDE